MLLAHTPWNPFTLAQRWLGITAAIVITVVAVPSAATAQDHEITSAESAGPASLSANATIMTWDMKTLRKGTNEWVCLPDNPGTDGPDPFCVNEPWLDFLNAMMNKSEPTYNKLGIAYMLAGDAPVSNTDPFATAPTADDDWVTGLGAHLMLLVPDHSLFAGMSTDPFNGGPWIMWPDTPYAHIMVPVESYSGP